MTEISVFSLFQILRENHIKKRKEKEKYSIASCAKINAYLSIEFNIACISLHVEYNYIFTALINFKERVYIPKMFTFIEVLIFTEILTFITIHITIL